MFLLTYRTVKYLLEKNEVIFSESLLFKIRRKG